ncbi:unnamed protein product [Pneumocystis jirovecii]|uniref:Uncharacterized protein n=1 Tax=Pneumocystis jirovecii TaxID=42068 RepID=L0PG29_PNEJI|nr:unnamed protein product [Pneumocystis jirovecii]
MQLQSLMPIVPPQPMPESDLETWLRCIKQRVRAVLMENTVYRSTRLQPHRPTALNVVSAYTSINMPICASEVYADAYIPVGEAGVCVSGKNSGILEPVKLAVDNWMRRKTKSKRTKVPTAGVRKSQRVAKRKMAGIQ